MKKENKECKNCNDCKRYQDEAFELEVDEDLHQERLNQFWKKYRFFIYAFVVIVLAATAGFQLYQSWRMKIRLEESDMFENAVLQIFAQKPDDARPALVQLAQNGRTGYKYLARLELAGLAARQNDVKKALAELKNFMGSDAPEVLKTVATLSYVGYQVDTGDVNELMQLLRPYLKNPAFVETAAELATVLYLRENKQAEAKKMLQEALRMPNLSDETQKKLKNLSQMIENG